MGMQLTSLAALRASPLGVLDRLTVLSMSLWMWTGVPVCIRTRVRYAEDSDEVGHELCARVFGIAAFWSDEVFSLGADGTSLTLRGTQRSIPTPWIGNGFGDAHGSASSDGLRTSLTYLWLGAPVRHETETTPAGVVVKLTQPWLQVEIRLTPL